VPAFGLGGFNRTVPAFGLGGFNRTVPAFGRGGLSNTVPALSVEDELAKDIAAFVAATITSMMKSERNRLKVLDFDMMDLLEIV
jgi:hypothetical protein